MTSGVRVLIKEDFNERSEFEEVLQKITSNMTRGMLSEKLPPSELLRRTDNYVSHLTDLATNNKELMLILKPEKAFTIKYKCKNLIQTLTNFKDVLLQNTPNPLANSRLAFEQLRKASADGSDFLFLMREIKDNPSPLIDAILTFKKASETKRPIINIRSEEEVQPLIKYVLGRMDDFRNALVSLEKNVNELKQIIRKFQEESLEILSSKASTQNKLENKIERKQLSLSNFKKEKN